MRDISARDESEVIDPVRGRKGSRHGYPERIDDALYAYDPKLNGRLLQCADRPVGERFFKHPGIKDQPFPPHVKERDFSLYIEPAEEAAQGFAHDGADRASGHARTEPDYKEQVSGDIDRRAHAKENEGRPAVPQRPERRREKIVNIIENESAGGR